MAAAPRLVAAADVSGAAGAAAQSLACDTQMAEAPLLEQVVQAGATAPAAQPVMLETLPLTTAAAAGDEAQQLHLHTTSADTSAAVAALAAPSDAAVQLAETIRGSGQAAAGDMPQPLAETPEAAAPILTAKQYSSDSEGSLPEIDSGPSDSGSDEEQS